MKACQPAVESNKTSAEIASSGNDSPGCSLTKLPDPWLFDSEALIREIDRIREVALQVPTSGDANATHFGLQLVIDAAWTLRENLRYLLQLHREAQRAFGKRKISTDETRVKHQTIYVQLSWA